MDVKKPGTGTLVVRIFGGLGNQLFIYAAAKRLALKNDCALKLDVMSGYVDDPFRRTYCLDHFNIDEEIASPRDSYLAQRGEKKRYWARKINRFLLFNRRYHIEQDRPFDKRLLDLEVKRTVYLQGYWQDERYFKDIEDVVRHNLTITTPHDQANVQLADKMARVNAVCLHARRNDYEHALPLEYYHRALSYIMERVENPHFFCFSDNPGWLETLSLPSQVTVVTQNGDDKNYEDLWLMSKCQHYIIANSTFSWWGAWLNQDPEKIVIAPSEWGYDTVIPEKWVTI